MHPLQRVPETWLLLGWEEGKGESHTYLSLAVLPPLAAMLLAGLKAGGEMLQETRYSKQPLVVLIPFMTLRAFSKSSRHLTPWCDHHPPGQNCSAQAGTVAGNCESLLQLLPEVEVSPRWGKRAVCQVNSFLPSSPASWEPMQGKWKEHLSDSWQSLSDVTRTG